MSFETSQRVREQAAAAPDGASQRELARLVAALLEAPANKLDLPPRLMKLYLQSRWTSRRDLIVAWLLGFAAINALCALFDPFMRSQPEIWLFFTGRLGVSVFLVAAAVTLRTMETAGREGVFAISGCVAMIVVSGFGGLLIDAVFMERVFAQAMFAGAAAIVVARISWDDTLILAMTLLALLVMFMTVTPGLSVAERGQTIALYGSAIVGLTWMRCFQNRYLYRVFLEGLSARLKSDEMKGANGRLAAMALTDPLTLLPNRRHFDEVLAAIEADGGADHALFMIDVDCFKRLNDDRGHGAGDECLRTLANVIRDELRHGQDFLARFGGEEFVAVLPDLSPAAALQVAERVREAVAARRLPNRLSPFGVVTVSVGVATASTSGRFTLLAEADAALYEAKALGRNRVRSAQDLRSSRVA